ncbi:protein-tyrosine-phosphatase [Malassezia nana]|uniref:Protein-tyrosine-phosphatase n=1 Tax=Malassezia nana TaxID=180528 RepID=A0AAF0EQG0_9BASI|nr:protein-tyrosine-phosphatase [Malassezia nana]
MRSEAPWPKLVVFDLDYTLWPVCMYELIGKLWVDTHVDPPLQRRAGALNEVVDRGILFELKRRNVQVAAASRTCAPRVARQALQGLWIASTPDEKPVSVGCSKVAHFEQLAQATGIDYVDMLFYDDEHRNADVQKKLGVHFVQVGSRGLDRATFEQGLQAWRKRRQTAA